MTFMRFLNLGLNDKAPDAKTIWKFRNDLATGSALVGEDDYRGPLKTPLASGSKNVTMYH